MAPEVDLGWGDPPKDPEGPAPAPPNPEPAGPEPGEYRYDDTIAASDGVKKGFLSTALGAAGKMIANAGEWLYYDGLELVIAHWRIILVGLASLGLLTLQWAGWAKADPLFVFVTGTLAAAWVAVSYWNRRPTEEDEEGEPKPRKRQKLTKEERQARRESRLAFWGTESHPFLKGKKKSLISQIGEFLSKVGWTIFGMVMFAIMAAWEFGKVLVTKPVDKSRTYGDRKVAWGAVSILTSAVVVAVLLANPIWVRDRYVSATTAGLGLGKLEMPHVTLPALPKLPEFRWPTWGKKDQVVAVLPVPTPTPKTPATAWNGGFRRKSDPATSVPVAAVPPAPAAAPPPVAAPAPAPTQQPPAARPRPTKSVREIKREVREIEREIPVFTRQVKRELEALERERKAATAKATAVKKQPTPAPTTMMAMAPATVAQVVQPIGMTRIQKLEAELERVRKERDEAREKVSELSAKPVPTPITITKTTTVSVPGPTRIVERKIPGPVRIVRQVQEVKVPVVKTVTKTRIKTVTRTVPGPERVVIRDRKVPGPTRTVTRTVRVPVHSPPRVVYRDRTVATTIARKGSDPAPVAQRKRVRPQKPLPRVVVQAQQPTAQQTTTTRSSDPYGGDPYDY